VACGLCVGRILLVTGRGIQMNCLFEHCLATHTALIPDWDLPGLSVPSRNVTSSWSLEFLAGWCGNPLLQPCSCLPPGETLENDVVIGQGARDARLPSFRNHDNCCSPPIHHRRAGPASLKSAISCSKQVVGRGWLDLAPALARADRANLAVPDDVIGSGKPASTCETLPMGTRCHHPRPALYFPPAGALPADGTLLVTLDATLCCRCSNL
jgi:hypothetical protein